MSRKDLNPYLKTNVVEAADIAAAQTLIAMVVRNGGAEPDLLGTLLLCLALRTPRDRHTCIDLDHISDWLTPEGVKAQLEWPTDSATWLAATKSCPLLFGAPGTATPLIVDDRRVYLGRSFAEEGAIAAALTRNNAQHVHIVLGGPGTGKTREVAMKFIDRFKKGERDIRVALAAPTGKAAARMREVLLRECDALKNLPEGKDVDWDAVNAAISAAFSGTVHSLLGFGPSRDTRYKFNADNYLPFDWVVIDEASMLPSSMMYRLVDALDPSTALLLVGDPDQLASVDAGSVLGDIAKIATQKDSVLFPQTNVMRKQFRLPPEIDGLARLLRLETPLDGQALGDSKHVDAVIEYLNSNKTLISWINPDIDKDELMSVRKKVVDHARQLHEAAMSPDPQLALKKRQELQLLCAHREGKTGVSYWNGFVEHELGAYTEARWYFGRPVMVTRNNGSVDLYNGDVGIIVPDSGGQPVGVFSDGGTFRLVPTMRLEDVESVHALTIHKSQGSEYDEVIVVLPNESSRILTRELFYTGITRTKNRLTIIGSEAVLRSAVS
ncbi:MAG: exodeoxyribonuclease V subunit alpha, partial [Ilumatobacteraceae bacterium]|nr:exodeoxyribonuclease V subunit alpha [Ilumatobacteraceae bacterium]